MIEIYFTSVKIGSNGYKLEQMVNEDNKTVTKKSDVAMWLIGKDRCNTTYCFPISKLDLQNEVNLPVSAFWRFLYDRTRRLVYNGSTMEMGVLIITNR